MNCPDAAPLAEVSSVFEGDTLAALAHITTCPDCKATLAMFDQLATAAKPVVVPSALYDRLDEAISFAARAADTNPASQISSTADTRWRWHTLLFPAVAIGASLGLLAAVAPSTSSRPIHWPALMVLSALGGLALTLLERRTVR